MPYVRRPWPYSAGILPRPRPGDPLWASVVMFAVPYGGRFFDIIHRRLISFDPGPTPFRIEPAPRSRWPAAYGDGDNSYVHAYRWTPSVGTGPFTIVTGYVWDGSTASYQTPVGFGGYGTGTNIGIYVPKDSTGQCAIDSTAMGTTNLNGMVADQNQVRSYGYSVAGSGQVARGYKDGIYTGDTTGALIYDETGSYWINKAQSNEGAWGWHLYDIIFNRVLSDAEHRELAPDRIWRHLEPVSRVYYVPVASTGQTLSGAVSAQPATTTGALTIDHPVSGAVSAQPATATGALTIDHPLSGAVAAQPATTTGAIIKEHDLSGAVAAQSAQTTGSLSVAKELSGAVVAQPATTTGQIVKALDLSGAVAAQLATTTGQLTKALSVSGAVVAQSASTSGQLSITPSLYGDVQAQPASTTAQLIIDHALQGVARSGRAVTTGTATIDHKLSGAVATSFPASTSGFIQTETEAKVLGGILKKRRAKNLYIAKVGDKLIYGTSEREVSRQAMRVRRQLAKVQKEGVETKEQVEARMAVVPKTRIKKARLTREEIEEIYAEVEQERLNRKKKALYVVLMMVD